MPFGADAQKKMSFALASQILAFFGFLATVIAVIRYLNPAPEYIIFADLVGKVRQKWTEYESEGMPADESTMSFLSTLERLEDEVRDLLFVMKTKSIRCQLRAWTNALRIKRLSDQAQLLRIGLPFIVQVNRVLYNARRNPTLTLDDLVAVGRMSRSRDELMCLIRGDGDANTVLQIPPVPWTPSLDDFRLRRVDTILSSDEGTDSFFEHESPPEIVLSPSSTAENLEARKLTNVKTRSILKKLFTGVRKKRNSYDSDHSV